MKRRQTRKRNTRKNRRRLSRKKQQFFSRKTRVYRGGADLPVPEGSVVGVDLDPKDPYSVPILVSKDLYEKEVIED